jgi:hypothetical protein
VAPPGWLDKALKNKHAASVMSKFGPGEETREGSRWDKRARIAQQVGFVMARALFITGTVAYAQSKRLVESIRDRRG